MDTRDEVVIIDAVQLTRVLMSSPALTGVAPLLQLGWRRPNRAAAAAVKKLSGGDTPMYRILAM